MSQRSNVCPRPSLTKDRFQELLRQAWSRISSAPGMTQITMAARMGVSDPKTISRALACTNVPEAHTVFNSLCADPTALDEIFREYGLCVRPIEREAANDMETAARLSHAAGSLIEALRDGRRDHRETLQLAALFRPLILSMGAIVEDADRLRDTAA